MNSDYITFGKEIQIDEDLADYMDYKFKVRYLITGKNHDGYCSGNDTEEDFDFQGDRKIYKQFEIEVRLATYIFDSMLDDKKFVKDEYLPQLDYINRGCINLNGSGYCRGFGQKYKAIRAKFIG